MSFVRYKWPPDLDTDAAIEAFDKFAAKLIELRGEPRPAMTWAEKKREALNQIKAAKMAVKAELAALDALEEGSK